MHLVQLKYIQKNRRKKKELKKKLSWSAFINTMATNYHQKYLHFNYEF